MSTRPWTATALTIFPEMFPGPLATSLAGRALERGDWMLETVDIREFAANKHRTVDDAPFGGGAGMVMKPDVVDAALTSVRAERQGQGAEDRLIYLTPRGRLLDQQLVGALSEGSGVVLLCGRFEGVDQRVIEAHGMDEVSLGDFVLSGGEPAALCLIDAVVRLLPGVMGNADSAGDESFGEPGLLEYPHYTRPAEWMGRDGVSRAVPEVLMSGDHAKVRAWRRAEAERITRERRPDLWQRRQEPAAER